MQLLPRRDSIIAVLLTSAVVVVAILWIMCYWNSLLFGLMRSRDNRQERHKTFWGVYAQRGQVGIARVREQGVHSPYSEPRKWDVDHELIFLLHRLDLGPSGAPWMSLSGRNDPDTFLGHLGFEVVSSGNKPGPWSLPARADEALIVPWWLVFLVTLTVALRWTFFRERRLYWPKVGRCAACGYDLRETRERCPECGHAIGSSAS